MARRQETSVPREPFARMLKLKVTLQSLSIVTRARVKIKACVSNNVTMKDLETHSHHLNARKSCFLHCFSGKVELW